MASFTPSNFAIANLGSTKLTIGHINEDILSGSNYWTTGITDIKSVICQAWTGAPLVQSTSVISVSWTASSGTVNIVTDASISNTGFILWILSGGPMEFA